jgi:hypothetical protein
MTEQIFPGNQSISKIKESAHWRVVLRPREFKKERISRLSELWNIIEETQVRFRGWYYPHISHRQEERVRGIDYIGCWCTFEPHIEYWRFYQSGQFIHLFAFGEDNPRYAEILREYLVREVPLTPQQLNSIRGFVDITSSIYTFTEIFEFANRLAQRGVLYPECQIIIRMHNIMGRALSFSDFRRALNDLYIAQVESLEKPWPLASKDLIARTRELAIEASLWFFERFGLEMLDSVIADIQEGLFKRAYK